MAPLGSCKLACQSSRYMHVVSRIGVSRDTFTAGRYRIYERVRNVADNEEEVRRLKSPVISQELTLILRE